MLEIMQRQIDRTIVFHFADFIFFMFYFSMLCVFIKVLVHQSLCSMFIKVLLCSPPLLLLLHPFLHRALYAYGSCIILFKIII